MAVVSGGDSVEVSAEQRSFGGIIVPWCGNEDIAWAGETGGLIDVAICIVADDAMSWEPDDVFGLEPDVKDFGHDFAGHTGVAIGVEEAAVGGEDSSFAIPFDGSAFEDKAGANGAQAESGGDSACGELVEVPWRVLAAPRIVVPIEDHAGPCGWGIGASGEEDGAVIAAPGIIDGNIEPFWCEAGTASVAGGIEEVLSGVACMRVTGKDSEGFKFGDGGGEFGEFGGDSFEDAWPCIGINGPCGPCGGVSFPFGGPAVVMEGQHFVVRRP